MIEISGKINVSTYQRQISQRFNELEQEKLARIREYEQEILALKSSYNAASPAHQLPAEILSIIFTFASKDPSCSEPLSASHVCKRWRAIALDCSHLWTDFPNERLRHVNLTKALLSKSKNAPLRLLCISGKDIPDEPCPDAVREVLGEVNRLKSVVLHNEDGEGRVNLRQALDGWPQTPAPLLEKVFITNKVDTPEYSDVMALQPEPDELATNHVKGGLRLLRDRAPALHYLTLSHLGIEWQDLPLGPSLKHLRLLESSEFSTWTRPNISSLIDSFKAMPLLESIELHNLLPQIRPQDLFREVYTLPHALKTLTLSDSPIYLGHMFQITRVLDHVAVTLSFLEEDTDGDDVGRVLGHLKSSCGAKRGRTAVKKASVHDGYVYKLDFGTDESSETIPLGRIVIRCKIGDETPALERDEYYTAVTSHFDLSSLQYVDFSRSYVPSNTGAWTHLPTLKTLRLSSASAQPFISHLLSDPILSIAGAPNSAKQCYFPALTTLICSLPLFKFGFSPRRLVDILNARKGTGAPVPKIYQSEGAIREETVAWLERAVPELSVIVLPDDDVLFSED